MSHLAEDSRGLEDFAATTSEAFVGGVTVNWPAVSASALLLLVLLGLTFERTLGLDKIVAAKLREWRATRVEERRQQIMDARVKFEEIYDEDSSDVD